MSMLLGCGSSSLSYFPMEIADDLHVDFSEKLEFTFEYMCSLPLCGIIPDDDLVNCVIYCHEEDTVTYKLKIVGNPK